MKIEPLAIQNAFLISPKKFLDERGTFVKTFHVDSYKEHQLETVFKEEYYSTSKKHVLRGMHFQSPPHDHVKLVYCISGEVLDVILDLRKDSPTFGEVYSTILNEENAKIMYIPKGLAHGFMVLSDSATLVYKTSTRHYPESDAGILWNSFGFEWPYNAPVISERDKNFLTFSEFNSPFRMGN